MLARHEMKVQIKEPPLGYTPRRARFRDRGQGREIQSSGGSLGRQILNKKKKEGGEGRGFSKMNDHTVKESHEKKADDKWPSLVEKGDFRSSKGRRSGQKHTPPGRGKGKLTGKPSLARFHQPCNQISKK